jgi:hypothetical protein
MPTDHAAKLRAEAAELSGMRLAMADWLDGLAARGLPPPCNVYCDVAANAEWERGRRSFQAAFDLWDGPGRWQYIDRSLTRDNDWTEGTPEQCAAALSRFLARPL